MSRIGRLAIVVPDTVNIIDNVSSVTVTGKFGTLDLDIPPFIEFVKKEGRININLKEPCPKNANALRGLYRTLLFNLVIGVSEQFETTLLLKGVGYRAIIQENEIVLSLGFSHPVKLEIPKTINAEVIQNTTIILKSCDKELLGLFAAKVRSWREPEPYKGKGILYKNEIIQRKAGKSGK
jgi:large subunit ribosomal protein L6|uniref:Ribosomal protein L6 n=1 Tax=Asterionella formosa TaxID=210441 RepID=A0A023H9S4_9STRA|nr:ribosomal protein L6 [Asterionella formosa]AGH28236.1 ribosomal protein L6 [Asterionella formosa]WGN98946.1 ribosomal protein L6 [Asterionella formosa]